MSAPIREILTEEEFELLYATLQKQQNQNKGYLKKLKKSPSSDNQAKFFKNIEDADDRVAALQRVIDKMTEAWL